MTIGVVVVTYNASDIILDCLESLLASTAADVRIVVVDNASPDDTLDVIRTWAADPSGWTAPEGEYFTPVPHGPVGLVTTVPAAGGGEIALIDTGANTGFAGGVNVGMRLLQADPDIDYFWVLNPDCMTENDTAAKLETLAHASGDFSLIGGRVYLKEPRNLIQVDGGRINFLTGICTPYNASHQGADIAAPETAVLDYISGAHMLASRAFLDRAGLMDEDYFLYYEEIDWAMKRGDMPLIQSGDAAVHHDGGHSLGSATVSRGPSAMSAYFMARSRMRFMWLHRPMALPLAYLYTLAKSVQYLLKGQIDACLATIRGINGLRAPRNVRKKLTP